MVDIEQLINEVYERTPIWDSTNVAHHNRGLIFTLWQEIATSLGIKIEVAKTKWKNLRDNFRAELKKSIKGKSENDGETPHVSNWVWFQKLLFLKDQMLSRKMSLQRSTVTSGSAYVLTMDEGLQEDDTYDDSNSVDPIKTEIDFGNSEIEDQSSYTDHETPTISNSMYGTKRKRDEDGIESELLNLERKKIQLIQTQLAHSYDNQKLKPEDDLHHFLLSLYKPLSDLPNHRQMYLRIKIQQLIYNEMIDADQSREQINATTS
uniref:Uncharacterized protein LOC114333295 n=1 Tax=Diabrotica virgifera virgifera TaxID=50390 RepID=A0A6P7FRH1_DIAVI